MQNKKGLKDCPGCQLLVTKLEQEYNIRMEPDQIPQFVKSLINTNQELKEELSMHKKLYAYMDAENTKENVLLSLEVQEAERELAELKVQLEKELACLQEKESLNHK